jgi:hypothetical protein
MRRKHTVISLAIAALVACSDSTAPNPLLGQLLFAYSGGIAGNFNASFAPLSAGQNEFVSYVAGQHDASDGMVYALASVSTGTNERNFAIVAISRTTPGDATINANCTGQFCAGFLAIFGQNSSSGNFTQLCELTAGTVTITSLTATRVKGTFSGTGNCSGPTGTITSFTVTGGSFDAALVSDTPDT